MMWPFWLVAMPADSWPAVLERVEREVRVPRDLAPRSDYAEDSALIARAIAVFQEEREQSRGTGCRGNEPASSG